MCLQSVQKPAELKHLTPAEEKKSNEISVVTASEPEPQRPTRMVNYPLTFPKERMSG